MNLNQTLTLGRIGSILAFIVMNVSGLLAQVPTATPPVDPLDRLRSEVADLRKKVEKPQKDAWDKLTSLSGLTSGIVVALIGFYATNVYNRRQKISEDRRKDQEILIAQIQTVEKFIPHLASADEQKKGAALIAIAALGNEDLAVKLATAFKGPGATTALTTIAATAAPEAAKNAERALEDVLALLKPRVVTIHNREARRATGFVVSSDGLVLTAAHAVKDMPPSDLYVGLPDDRLVKAVIVKIDTDRDLALLKTDTKELLTPLDLSPSTPLVGENVVAMLIGLDARISLRIGTLVAEIVRPGEVGGRRIEVSLPVEPGASGTPVVDKEGRLFGLVRATTLGGNTQLIPASEALAFVARSTEG